MPERLNNFYSLKNHGMLGKVFNRLKKEDIEFCRSFILKNANLSKGDFELKVNRTFIDVEKPKTWKEILELLTCANSM